MKGVKSIDIVLGFAGALVGPHAAEVEFAKLRLLDTQINLAEREEAIVAEKASRLKWAMGALAIGVLFTALGLGLQ